MSALQSTGESLRLLHHDVRVTAGGLQLAHHVTPGNCAGEFARAIMGRYGGQFLRWSRLGLVFRQGQPEVTVQHIYHRNQLHLAPRLTLTVLNRLQPGQTEAQSVSAPASRHYLRGPWSEREAAAPSVAPSSVWPTRGPKRLGTILRTQIIAQPGLVPTIAQPRDSRPVLAHWRSSRLRRLRMQERIELGFAKQLVQRLVTRRKRLEPVDTRNMPEPGGATAVPRPPVQPVPKVIQRPAKITVAAQADPRPPDDRPRVSRSPFPVADKGLYSQGSAPIDINDLTTQVIRAIDRRIIANRERMGRT